MQELLEHFSFKLLFHAIFAMLCSKSFIGCFMFHNGQYTISWIPLAAIFSTHTKLKQKTSTYIPKTFRKWLLSDVIFLLSPSQSIISCFTKVISKLFEYVWQSKFSNYTNWNQKPLLTSQELLENIIFKLLSDIIFLPLPSQSIIPCFTRVSLQLVEYRWQPNFSDHTQLKIKTSTYISRML